LTILNHEFRTPLTLVVAYADMLKDFNPDTMSQEEVVIFLKGVNSGADRLHRLIENFIYLVELENGKYALQMRAIPNFGDLVQEAYIYAAQPENRTREFVLKIPAELPTLHGDAELLTLALRELLDNAAKFSPSNSVITLEVTVQATQVSVAITDVGRGIEAHEFENIWQPFYQIKREEYEDQGAGSGLAIVERIAKLHQGSATVRSEFGKGSTFTLTLPLQPR
jgi:signal transduction histidine kinase